MIKGKNCRFHRLRVMWKLFTRYKLNKILRQLSSWKTIALIAKRSIRVWYLYSVDRIMGFLTKWKTKRKLESIHRSKKESKVIERKTVTKTHSKDKTQRLEQNNYMHQMHQASSLVSKIKDLVKHLQRSISHSQGMSQ